ANTLFNIWIKYKPRLPEWYYNEKLLKVGDSLAQIKVRTCNLSFVIHGRKCFNRYRGNAKNTLDLMLSSALLSSSIFSTWWIFQNKLMQFHALQERNVCIYQMVCNSDRNLQNQESLQTCFNVLSSLRLAMQVALPQESLCWLIYNGTIHIYTICRHLMVIGQSAKVLEYLLWASICMESSIPLLSVHYLTWRATLYTAVSQCYFDCQASIHGEIFARRGLIKIDELKQLSNISSSLENSETKKIFREATLKMSVMIFKRAVYESRRKPKSYFRPKLRVSLKEAQNLPWPRTATERLLTEMFHSAAAQFLAILEALSDSSRHVLRPAPPVPDEIEIRDVISELFFAGLEILSGNSIKKQKEYKTVGLSQLSIISVKIYSNLHISFLNRMEFTFFVATHMVLGLAFVAKPVLITHQCFGLHSIKAASPTHPPVGWGWAREASLRHGEPSHDLMILATTVYSCVSTSKQNIQPDKEILVDVTMFLWQKCKMGLQQIRLSGSDCLKYIHKYKAYQWVRVLWIINEVIQKSIIADINVVILAEVTLSLTTILENVADS
ncbi:CFA54 protein, partial [Phaetusa simplex]|nr:CFA54 protein [Phaetusa simplex]